MGNKIAKMPRSVRKAIVLLLRAGHNIDDIMENIQIFAVIENNTHDYWYNKMARDIKELRIDPDCYAYQLAADLGNRKIKPSKAVKLAEVQLTEQQKITGGYNGRQLEQVKRIVQQYISKSDLFFKYSVPFIMNYDKEGLIAEIECHKENERKLEEDKLFQLQTIKHVQKLLEYNKPIPKFLLEAALLTEFSNDQKILSEQVIMVYRTHNYHMDDSFVVKQICFNFTKHILTNVIANAILVDYLFKEFWISCETVDLLVGAYDNIKRYGMHPLVYGRAKGLFEKNGLAYKKPEHFNILDRNIISLMEKFKM